MKKQTVFQSFNSAIEGFIYVVGTQRNMRLHFLIAILVLLVGVHLNLEKNEILLLLVSICFVMLAEMVNTAVEMSVNLISDKFNPVVRVIKDITAGSVLVAAINAFIVGYLLFLSRPWPWQSYVGVGINRIKSSPWHITLLIIIIILFLVILSKALLHKGEPLRGGMPSGHAAVAFSIWSIIALSSTAQIVKVLAFVLAFLVARSRVSSTIHTLTEVIAGSLLGTLVTILIFQMLG